MNVDAKATSNSKGSSDSGPLKHAKNLAKRAFEKLTTPKAQMKKGATTTVATTNQQNPNAQSTTTLSKPSSTLKSSNLNRA